MTITKKKLDDIKRCYATTNLVYDNKNHLVFASEDPNIICESFSGDNFENVEEIWKEAGGCMSIIQLEDKDKEFLAIQEFYMKVSPSLAKVVWGKNVNGKWEFKNVLKIPYMHIFDVYKVGNISYFIGATIATSKQNKEDWSVLGRIYVGRLLENLEDGIEVEILKDGMFRNHGYCRDTDENGNVCGYFGCDRGIYRVYPPKNEGAQWTIDKVLDGQIGEISIIDIDNDGKKEIMTIEAFHGNQINIYKQVNDTWEKVYTYGNKIDFAHSLVAGTLRGVPTFLAGVRREDAELFYVQFKDGKFITGVIDKGVGPANLYLLNEKDRDLILSANHMANEAAVYIISD